MLDSAWRTALIVAVFVPLAAACSRDTARFGPPAGAAAGTHQPSGAPTAPVTREELPPPGEDGQRRDEGPWTDQGDDRMAALPRETRESGPVSQEDVLGQWSVRTPEESCQLNVSLTSWEGGYRASTRNCSSPELASVGAWNLEGNLVVLKDDDGNPVARLQRGGGAGFDGRLELGGSVSMNR